MLAGLSPLAGLGPLAGGPDATAAPTVVSIVSMDSFGFSESRGSASVLIAIVSMDSAGFSDGFTPQTTGGGGASMALVDSFTGAAGTQLQSHTPDAGGSWTLAAAGFMVDGACLTAAGRLRWNEVGSGAATLYYWSSTPASAQYSVSAAVYVASQAGVAAIHALYDEVTGYGVSLQYDGSTGVLTLQTTTGSGTVAIGSATLSWAVGSTHTIELTVSKGSASAYVDGSQVVAPGGVDLATLGHKIGVGFSVDGPGTTGSDSTLIHLDDLKTDAGGSAPAVTTGVGPEFVAPLAFDTASAWESSSSSASVASRESWGFLDAGTVVVTIVGPVAITSADSFGWNGSGAVAATLSSKDLASMFEAFAPAAQTYFVTAVDSLGFVEGSGLAASIQGSESFGAWESISLSAGVTGFDGFGGVDGGIPVELQSDVPKLSSDLFGFADKAMVSIGIQSSDSFAAADELSSVGASVGSSDSGSFWSYAEAGVAPYPVQSIDAMGFVEGVALEADPTGTDSLAWATLPTIGAAVSSRDSAAFGDWAFIALNVTAFDTFGFADAQALRAFTAALVYNVYANAGDGGPIDYASALATVDGLSWTSPPLAASSDHWFAVRAFSVATSLEERNIDAAVHVVLDPARKDVSARPAPPTAIRASAVAGGKIRVEWSDKRPAGTSLATGYRVYQGVGSVDWTTPVADVSASTGIAGAFYTVVGPLVHGTTYAFGVRAYNGSAEESNTSQATATADAQGPSAVGGFSIGLTSES